MSINSAPLRAIHLLALAPISPQRMVQRTKIPLPEVESLLKEYGRSLDDGTYTLGDEVYKDLRVWERKYSEEQRTKVIADSIEAFDRLGYPKDHPARQKLTNPALRKAEVEAVARKRESKRRAQADAAEKVFSDQQAKIIRAVGQSSANSPVTSPHGQLPTQNFTTAKNHSSMLQKITKIGKKSQTNGSAYKSSLNSSSSSGSESETRSLLSSTSPEPAVAACESDNHRDGARPQPQFEKVPTGHVAASANNDVTITTHKRKMSVSHAATALGKPTKRQNVERSTGTTGLPASSTPFVKPPSQQQTRCIDHTSSFSSAAVSRDKDMFALAQSFREKYSIYAKLYRTMSAKPRAAVARDRLRVQELISLHKELESVKKRLWQMSPSIASSPGVVKHPAKGARARLLP
jgi:RNA polymerase II elongation factor ELL